jgi:hypothetical protein
VATKERVIYNTYRKCQINISVEDPNTAKVYVEIPKEAHLCLSFESSDFRDGWDGLIEFRLNTNKACQFRAAFVEVSAQQGAVPNARSSSQ